MNKLGESDEPEEIHWAFIFREGKFA